MERKFEDIVKVSPVYRDNTHGRNVIVLRYADGFVRTINNARYVVECELKRTLSRKEAVHHIDGDKTNDSIENLMVLSAKEHQHIHHLTYNEEDATVICSSCGKEFVMGMDAWNSYKTHVRREENKYGPYCSEECRVKKFKEVMTKPEEKHICPSCGLEFTLKGKRLASYKRDTKTGKSKSGPYCSPGCAGRYNLNKKRELASAQPNNDSSDPS